MNVEIIHFIYYFRFKMFPMLVLLIHFNFHGYLVSGKEEVVIDVYFQSLCPHSNMFISEQLAPTMKKFENEGSLCFRCLNG